MSRPPRKKGATFCLAGVIISIRQKSAASGGIVTRSLSCTKRMASSARSRTSPGWPPGGRWSSFTFSIAAFQLSPNPISRDAFLSSASHHSNSRPARRLRSLPTLSLALRSQGATLGQVELAVLHAGHKCVPFVWREDQLRPVGVLGVPNRDHVVAVLLRARLVGDLDSFAVSGGNAARALPGAGHVHLRQSTPGSGVGWGARLPAPRGERPEGSAGSPRRPQSAQCATASCTTLRITSPTAATR